MDFNLQNSWFDFSVLKHLTKHGGAHVAASNVANQSFSHQLLHGLVSLLVSHSCDVRLHSWESGAGVVDPLRRVSGLNGNKLQRDREVN